MIHGAHLYQMTQNKYMIYLIILKFHEKDRSAATSNINSSKGRLNVLSVLRSHFK